MAARLTARRSNADGGILGSNKEAAPADNHHLALTIDVAIEARIVVPEWNLYCENVGRILPDALTLLTNAWMTGVGRTWQLLLQRAGISLALVLFLEKPSSVELTPVEDPKFRGPAADIRVRVVHSPV